MGLKAIIREYREGDIDKVDSDAEALDPTLDKAELEEVMLAGISFTMEQEETGTILGCFGAAKAESDPTLAAVWVDVSPYSQEHYPLAIAKAIIRHRKTMRRKYGIETIWTNIIKTDARSLRWIEWLGFTRMESPEQVAGLEYLLDSSYIYVRAT